MSDFSKEELELLKEVFNYAIGNPNGFSVNQYNINVMPLYGKIQFLIKNYYTDTKKIIKEFKINEEELEIILCGIKLLYQIEPASKFQTAILNDIFDLEKKLGSEAFGYRPITCFKSCKELFEYIQELNNENKKL